ncbi:hypothetical protein OSB04_007107 [Centaurea solstitialis]|uniref:BED-type domain-containing protein n=1 Tax=Centaurea solstitialis TaxID=347529 RepID=A0AA38WIB1_9ASTR|nr:hypothetical protein OSB04_007107 [Centaurea solstitialis]
MESEHPSGSNGDLAWKYCTQIDKRSKVKCNFCGKVTSGGIHRAKQHIVDVDRFGNGEESEDELELEGGGSGSRPPAPRQGSTSQPLKKQKRVKRTIDQFFTPPPEDVVKNRRSGKMKQTTNYSTFKTAMELVARCGSGFNPPSYHEIRVPYLSKEVKATEEMVAEIHQPQWAKYGCTIIMPSSCFMMLDEMVEEVGEENVVQVVTDNASAYVAAGRLLMAKRPHLYWTPCAAHCIDLMLEDIGNIPKVRTTLQRAMALNGYIYNRVAVVNLMRKFTGKRELVRPAVTRAKRVASFVLMPTFWSSIVWILKMTGPLVKVFRLVDGEKKPAMGYIYEAMDRAKEAIAKSFNNIEDKYKDVYAIIDKRWECQLHQPLHAAGNYLNPQLFYSNPEIQEDAELHSKRRNRLEQDRLNYLIYVKYNRALKERYDHRDVIDPISLNNIDDSNEWLVGRMYEDEQEDEDYDNDLTWKDVGIASGAYEREHNTRRKNVTASSSGKKKGKVAARSTPRLIDEDEEDKVVIIEKSDTEEEDIGDDETEEEGEDDFAFADDDSDDD